MVNTNTTRKPDLLLPEQMAAQRFTRKLLNSGFQKQALHVYQNAQGEALYWRIRLKNPKTGEKWIRPMSRSLSGQFVLQEPEFIADKPLYHLPELLKNPTETVWLVEGEWCADALIRLGMIATTSGGAQSVSETDWQPLAKRHVILWADNDSAGAQYERMVIQQLLALECTVESIVIQQLDLPPKGDCVDWLAAHPNATREMILKLPLERIKTRALDSENSAKDCQETVLGYNRFAGLFMSDERGVFYLGESEPQWICSYLKVTALARDPFSENWGRVLEFYDADQQLHTWTMPMVMLKGSGEEIRGELLRLGLQLSPSPKLRHLLLVYILSSLPTHRARCVQRIGWHQQLFVLPQTTFGETTEKVLYQTELLTQEYQQSGSLLEWQQNIGKLCIGNTRLVLSVCCAFAALLLHPSGMESGGIHWVGESSSGKTTALRVAASVFGGTEYLNRWRGTSNGIEALAAQRCDTLLILDELAQIDAHEAGEIAYMLANGSGKTRAGKNGNARKRHDWRILFLSAGEVGLAQHMLDAGKRVKAGQEVRLVDVPANAHQGLGIFEQLHHCESAAQLSRVLTQAVSTYYGSAAPAFLACITQSDVHSGLSDRIKTGIESFMRAQMPVGSSGQVYRVCERFALIAVAGELASEHQITGWAMGEASRAVGHCFQEWLQHRGNYDNQEKNYILAQVKGFFEAHGESRFSHWEDPNSHTLHRAGFRRVREQGIYFYVLPEVFRQEICRGYDYLQVCTCLRLMEWIECGQEQKAYRREYLPIIGRSRCYVFTPKLWES